MVWKRKGEEGERLVDMETEQQSAKGAFSSPLIAARPSHNAMASLLSGDDIARCLRLGPSACPPEANDRGRRGRGKGSRSGRTSARLRCHLQGPGQPGPPWEMDDPWHRHRQRMPLPSPRHHRFVGFETKGTFWRSPLLFSRYRTAPPPTSPSVLSAANHTTWCRSPATSAPQSEWKERGKREDAFNYQKATSVEQEHGGEKGELELGTGDARGERESFEGGACVVPIFQNFLALHCEN